MAVHLGILQTDSVLPRFRREHGDYSHMFRRLFSAVDGAVSFTEYNVQQVTPPDLVCDAYVITGSKCSVYEELAWIPRLVNFLHRALDGGKKVIGVCFGHQLMAHFFGGRVGPAPVGWGVGVHRSTVLHNLWWMGGAPERLGLLCSHKDQVMALPPQAELYLSNDFCPLSGFTMADQVITVQGHPEFTKAYASDLMKMRRDQLGEEVYRTGMDSLQIPTGEFILARWMLNFLQSCSEGRTNPVS